MISLTNRINEVRSYLASHHMYVHDEWLTGCVEFLTENPVKFTETELLALAKEQWLLNDLKEICPGSLPANLKEQRKTILNGQYVLQINAAIDIGTPAYQQYLKLTNTNMENVEATSRVEDKVACHRIIKLYLTDGVQEVTAIEYKPMRNLCCDMTPGCKALFKGPIECRRGILMLDECSITLLGGEVLELAESNTLDKLIANKLCLRTVKEKATDATPPPRNINLPTPHAQMPPSRPTDNAPTLDPTSEPTSRPIARVTSVQLLQNNFPDDEIDVEQLAAIEAQFTTNKRPSEEHQLQNIDKKIKMDSGNDPNDYPDDADIFNDEDEDYLREIEAKFDSKPKSLENNYPIPLAPEPFVYIKQINEMSEMDKAGKVFRVKGQIMKLLSKLFVSKECWSLRCTIVDGTGNIDVEFTSDVLSELVGLTPAQMNQLKKDISSKPECKQKAVSALTKAKDTLQVLYCIIELTILDTPKITKLIPFDHSHLNMLKKRVIES